MEITSYIEPELYIIVPVLYVLGTLIKKSSINDKYIPIILGVMGILLVTAYKLAANIPCGFSDILKVIFAGVTQGLLCAAGSVYADNIVKQMKKDKAETDDKTSDKSDKNAG